MATGSVPQDRQWEITVSKVAAGGEPPLSGAVIGLYADEECRFLIHSGESAPDGTVSFSGLISGQRYWLKELAAPPDYELDGTVYEAGEANPAVTIANTPKAPPLPPDDPGGSGGTGGSGGSGGSGWSGGSGESGTSGETGIPGEAGVSGGPENLDSGSGRNFTGDPNVPQTGDDTGALLAAALLSGGLLAAMTAYRLFTGKRREKE